MDEEESRERIQLRQQMPFEEKAGKEEEDEGKGR